MTEIEVDNATTFHWGSNEMNVDVTDSIGKVMTLNSSFQVENDLLGCDPYVGVEKQLTVQSRDKENIVLKEHQNVTFLSKEPVETLFQKVIPKVYIYFHICQIGIWKTVVTEIYSLMVSSGLLEQVDELCLGVLGTDMESIREIFGSEPKLRIVMVSFDHSIYERATLYRLHERARLEDCKILYLHSKGVTHPEWARERIKAWTDYMCYWVIERWASCLRVLDFSDTVGTEWLANHYRGNFWWANSDYLRTLPSTIGPEYTDPEFWIGTGVKGVIFNFMRSNVYPYHDVICQELYRDKDQDPKYICGTLTWLLQGKFTTCVIGR